MGAPGGAAQSRRVGRGTGSKLLADPSPAGYHAVVCSLFLHHLEDHQAVRLLGLLRHGDGVRAVLVSDLNWTAFGLLLAQVFCRLLSRSDVVHVDGPRSVRAAFTPAEALALAERAGLARCTVRRAFPARWLLSWGAP